MFKLHGFPALVRYYRNKNKQPIGTFVAIKDDSGTVRFGWSLVINSNSKPKETVVKKVGINLAFERAKDKGLTEVPSKLVPQLIYFITDSEKYFADAKYFEKEITVAQRKTGYEKLWNKFKKKFFPMFD